MNKIFIIISFLINFNLFSQKINLVDDKLIAKIEYSADKTSEEIFIKSKLWALEEFSKRRILVSDCNYDSKVILGVIFDEEIDFTIEIICLDGIFIVNFTNFFYKGKSLKEDDYKYIKKIEDYLFILCGNMQKYIRY